MLCRFKVKGYKGFKNEIDLNLGKHNDYQFNKSLIKDDIINKAIVYGNNASGKSNLGFAIFDIVFHLTDKNRSIDSIVQKNYLNMESNDKYAEFYYEFKFDNDRVIYKYRKESLYKLIYEELSINGKRIIEYDFNKPKNKMIDLEEAKYLNWKYNDNDISIVKYICNNTNLSDDNPLIKLMNFVNGMLWFRSVEASNFIGIRNDNDTLNNIIIGSNKVEDFSKFLKKNDIEYNLQIMVTPTGESILGVKIGKKFTSFESVISTGTRALWLYYCWEIYFNKVKFLFIDEFDATYHFDLAANIVKRLNERNSFQSILTSHNTYLMSNKLTRPDCTFILTPNSINNLSSCTDKELREAHNIEKLYREGLFTD